MLSEWVTEIYVANEMNALRTFIPSVYRSCAVYPFDYGMLIVAEDKELAGCELVWYKSISIFPNPELYSQEVIYDFPLNKSLSLFAISAKITRDRG